MESSTVHQDDPRWSVLNGAVRMMNRLTFPRKFALISLLFALPLGGLVWESIWEINQQVQFAQRELRGTEYLRPLRQLLADLLESRVASRQHAIEGPVARPAVVRLQAKIQQHMVALQESEERNGQFLATSELYATLRENWRGLREQLLDLPPAASDPLHQSLIADIRELMKHVGDTSNLILDPDLDSYYQMDAVLLTLPDRLSLVAQYVWIGEAASGENLTAMQQSQVIRTADFLDTNLEDAARGIQIAFQHTESPELRTRLEPLVRSATADTEWLANEMRLQADGGINITSQNIEAARRAFAANLQLWDATITELDELLQARIGRYAARRTLIVVATGISLLLVAYLWAGFYAAVMRTIASLESASKKMVEGDFSEAAPTASTRDELGKVVNAFNAIALRLRLEWEQAREESSKAREAEAAMREAEAKYHGIFENASEGIFQSTPEGHYLQANPALARICGFDTVEAMLDAVSNIESQLYVDEHRRQQFADEIREHGMIRNFESQVRRADGQVIWVSENARAVHDEKGSLLYYEGLVQDITERRVAESRLHAAIESAPNAMLMVDSDGLVVLANKQVERLLGFAPSELLGKDLGLLIPPSLRDRHAEVVRGFFRDAHVRMMRADRELTAMHKDGTEIPVEIGLAFLQTDDEMFAIASINDLRSKHEAARKLEEARRAAEEANRAKSEFLANMSHEIRTPMNGIIGMAELLANTPLNREQKDFLRIARQSADSLLRLLNDILDFSKIEAGKLELDCHDFSLRNSIGQVGQALSNRAAEKGLELACRIAPGLPDNLVGDAGRLRQIIVNLVGNAIKFTQEGEVVIDVERHSESENEIMLHFSVRDTGEGIPKARQDKIFDSFTQADTSTTRRFGGTGLGLAISKQLVQMMRGSIWLESQEGVGSTFHFTAAFEIQENSITHKPIELSSLDGTRVLVVDDNTTNLRIFHELLESWRLKPTGTESGRAALEEMKRAKQAGDPYRLVVLDLMMPEMDGLQLASLIRGDEDFADCPLIMVSSAVRPGDAGRCRKLGIARYLTKPVVQSDLLEAILETMSLRPDGEATCETPCEEVAESNGALKILLVEDGVINQQVAVGLLKHHNVVVANNGKEAVVALDNQSFDLVLMDVQMPVMDGLAATRHIRMCEQTSGEHIPIVAMTASAMKGDRERCLEAGMDGYLSKPIDREQLNEVIGQFGKCEIDPNACDVEIDEACGKPQSTVTFESKTQEDVHDDCLRAIDLEAAAERLPGGPENLQRLARTLLKECGDLMNDIRQGMECGDAELVERGAHTLKGSAWLFFATDVALAAERFELLGRESKTTDAADAFAELDKQVSRLKSALRMVVGSEIG